MPHDPWADTDTMLRRRIDVGTRLARTGVALALAVAVGAPGCGHGATALGRPAQGDGEDDVEDALSDPASLPAEPSEATRPSNPPSADRARAAQALQHALAAFRRGDYSAAEAGCKEALVLHPFLAPAHLTLGKIYLLRGMASDDPRRLQKARRLVQMALHLAPEDAETQALLALMPK